MKSIAIYDKRRWLDIKHPIILPQYRFIYLKRLCEYWRLRNKLLYFPLRIIYEHFKIKYNMDIPVQAKIGKGLRIEHIGGIVINPNVVIGSNVNLLNGVLLGAENRGNRAGNPTVGNYVWIGTNAAIVGNVSIGNNVLIAPGSYVNFNVPDNSIVMGNPGRVIPSEDATKEYIKYPIQEELY